MIHRNNPATLARPTPAARRLRALFSNYRRMRAPHILAPYLITLTFAALAHD